MAKQSLEPLSLLVWETSAFETSTTYTVWTQLNTSLDRAPEKAEEGQEASGTFIRGGWRPCKEELRAQLRDSWRTHATIFYLYSTLQQAHPCSLAHPTSLATLPMPRWIVGVCRIQMCAGGTYHPWEIVRAGRQIWGQSPGPRPAVAHWVSNPSSIPHHSCLSHSKKGSRETQPSLGVLTTLWGDSDSPAVVMPTVLSLLSSSHPGGFFFLFLKGHPFTSVCLGAYYEVSPCRPWLQVSYAV